MAATLVIGTDRVRVWDDSKELSVEAQGVLLPRTMTLTSPADGILDTGDSIELAFENVKLDRLSGLKIAFHQGEDIDAAAYSVRTATDVEITASALKLGMRSSDLVSGPMLITVISDEEIPVESCVGAPTCFVTERLSLSVPIVIRP